MNLKKCVPRGATVEGKLRPSGRRSSTITVLLGEQNFLLSVPRPAPHLVELLNWFLGLCTLQTLGFLRFSSFGS